jgi:hypothetical protein
MKLLQGFSLQSSDAKKTLRTRVNAANYCTTGGGLELTKFQI